MRKPRTSEKTTAQRLKESAIHLFGKYGYEGTTVRAIAKDAGVTAGQITVNFGSKENLFNEIVMDMCRMTENAFDPIIGQYSYLKQSGTLTEDAAWLLIEQIVDTQVAFSLDTHNADLVRIMNVRTFSEDIKTSAILSHMTISKIEDVFARLLQEVFANKRYLHARTVSRAVNGAIVSFGEHPDLLYAEVLGGSHMPDAQAWMKGYVRDFIMHSLRCEAAQAKT